MEVLSVSELCWLGQAMINIDSYTIFHSGPNSSNVHGVGNVLNPHALGTLDKACSHLVVLAERMLAPYIATM